MDSVPKYLAEATSLSQKNLQLKVLKSVGKTFPSDRSRLFCVLGPIQQSQKICRTFAKKSRWSDALVKQLEKKLKSITPDTPGTPDTKDKCAIDIRFDEGGVCQFLFFDTMASTFEFHTWLRESFSGHFKQDWDGAWELVVSDLPKAWQQRAIESFSSLSLISQWGSPKTSKKKKKIKIKAIEISVHGSDNAKAVSLSAQKGAVLGHASNLVRTLAEIPPNLLSPKTYRDLIQKRATEHRYKFEFLDHQKLTKMGANAFLAVSRASPEASGIVHIWKPGTKGGKKVVLVGKGLCFDTGGYDIKTKHMYGMKNDMTGSAVALSLFESLIALDFKHEVHAYLALTENLISETAYKSNEVVAAMDGTTIEVVNTDAEGRMALADTLVLARREKPDLVVDFATLTGAAVYSLDTRRSAIFGGPASLLQSAFQAGEVSGERTWPFPIAGDYREPLKSDVADLLQCRVEGAADHIYAATFLQNFIGEDTNWVHVDLSCNENKGGLGLVTSTTTGFGVRWGVEFITKHFSRKKV
jgi:leucyl aminopeptidase